MDVIISPQGPAEKTAKIQRGRPFGPGKSGNPQGRPKGSRNKTTMAVEALLDGEAKAIARKVVEKALEGDMAALRLCLERLLPPRRDRPVTFDLPKIENVNDLVRRSWRGGDDDDRRGWRDRDHGDRSWRGRCGCRDRNDNGDRRR